MLPSESAYTTIARALKPLEDSGVLKYLPSFECCGTCSGAKIRHEDWDEQIQIFATFNEQTKDRADDGMQLFLLVMNRDQQEDVEATKTVEDALISGGFDKIDPPEDPFNWLEPEFKLNTFFRDINGLLFIRGYFYGNADGTGNESGVTVEITDY